MEKDIMSSYEATVAGLLAAGAAFSQGDFNQIPFEGSWTAAQVLVHITKSNLSIAGALSLSGQPAQRQPDERVKELKDIFLDFNTKLKSPDFILPEPGIYQKEIVVQNLEHSITQIRNKAAKTDLSEVIGHPILGNITRLELLHFVVYHTTRHINQLNNMLKCMRKC